MHTIRFSIVVIILSLLLISLSYASPEKRTLRFGINKVDQSNWTPLLKKYLADELNANIQIIAAPNSNELMHKFSSDQMDFAYLSPSACFRSRENNATLILKSMVKDKEFFQFTIVVHAESPINILADLPGKRFAFNSYSSILQQATVLKTGLLLHDFTQIKFLQNDNSVIQAILNKDIDAGIVDDALALKFYHRGIRILHSSLPIPLDCVAVNKKLEHNKIMEIRQAFLNLDKNIPHHKEVFKSFRLGSDRFSKLKENDYLVVQKLVSIFDNSFPVLSE